jgi:hypothetical protein
MFSIRRVVDSSGANPPKRGERNPLDSWHHWDVAKERKRALPEKLAARLREDPWRDYPAVGDRAFFRPDSLYLEVTAVSAGGVTSRVTGPALAPELGEERTVAVGEWAGMFDEGTLLHLPERPAVGEAWTNARWELWFVVEVSGSDVVFEDTRGETLRLGLRPDGRVDDEGGWFRVNVDAQGESRESYEEGG